MKNEIDEESKYNNRKSIYTRSNYIDEIEID
jgi:hypothetical protein